MTDGNTVNRPVARPGVMAIAPYVPGKSKGSRVRTYHKLSSNETPLGPSPKAVEAYKTAASHLELYPDGSTAELREAIAGAMGINPAQIICGNGSDDLLGMITHAYIGEGDETIFTEHGFLMYRIVTLAAGGTPVVIPETDKKADVDAILAAVTPRTKIVFLANPNNPTGTYLPQSEVRRLHAGLPKNVVLVLDAAYAEYVRRNDYEAGIELVGQSENVIMTRTFSKVHGLAALRVGWAYGPEHMIDALNRIRGPFNINAPGLAAATAAIKDRAFLEAAVDHNAKWLPWLTEAFTELGIEVTPSVGNFLLLNFPEGSGLTAEAADLFLLEEGIVLRRLEPYNLPNALRMSIGSEEANRATVDALARFMKGGGEQAAHG
ncbi:histidinol-phosphate transaminase [Amorphus orientalis]|uniref:Histidinol-phosphate aminotransferase n=1 Tax=Amorphus orientalis TaxID=649198 RepID=A0AAE3VT29_9HYPH|nr:histidinol-phosphate transaminase [Amorphus orientalis]MDQ0317091.1 histidinol-phosphate aminotransferase [Amorphus orientalis]